MSCNKNYESESNDETEELERTAGKAMNGNVV
jgi:hypothetical protein